ncbi:MAG TPA: gamma carbonic anhydrase family protein [Firmicutes bacterium]|nr:gamma carbonic anhydrase family protein [Bacillota bacterium]
MPFFFKGKQPEIHKTAFIFDGAIIVGDVEIGEKSSIWFNSVVRGDVNYIKIGKFTNVQELSALHVDTGKYPLVIGDYVTIGHNAVLHGCTIKDNALIGMGAIVLNGAEVGELCVIGAGALVTENSKIPPGTLAVGIPAKVKRELTTEEKEQIKKSAAHYVEIAEGYEKK